MPGLRMRFLPLDSWLLIVCTESLGRAMKNRLIGIEAPGVRPAAHVVPEALRCTAGTNTW